MNLALWAAKTGLDAQNTQMAVISNNLANSNTTGFKADRAAFQDLMYQNVQQVGAQSTQNTQYSTGLSLGTGVKIAATEKNYAQGSVLQTGGTLDMSVTGLGLFPDHDAGRHARIYARRFLLDGFARAMSSRPPDIRFRPRSPFPSAAQSVYVGNDGTVSVTDGGRRQGDHGRPDSTGQLHQRGRTAAVGNNLLVESGSSGSPQVGDTGHQRARLAAAGFARDLQRQHGDRTGQHDHLPTRL